jgi:flagellar secretion chaperone FliS
MLGGTATGMYGRTSALRSYGRVANAESDPLQQLVMLYDGAIKFLRLAAADIEARDMASKAEHTGRALDIVGYLQSILDFKRGGEVAPALDALYNSVTAITLHGSAHLEAGELRRAADLLAPVRDAWATNAAANNPAPLAQARPHGL